MRTGLQQKGLRRVDLRLQVCHCAEPQLFLAGFYRDGVKGRRIPASANQIPSIVPPVGTYIVSILCEPHNISKAIGWQDRKLTSRAICTFYGLTMIRRNCAPSGVF